MREHGIALAGPGPASFAADVPAGLLRQRMREYIADFLPGLESWTTLDIPWSQRYAVASMCRMLYTLEHGAVTTKPAALEWALEALDAHWQGLIRQARDERSLGWDPRGRTSPARVAATRGFVAYGQSVAMWKRGAESNI